MSPRSPGALGASPHRFARTLDQFADRRPPTSGSTRKIGRSAALLVTAAVALSGCVPYRLGAVDLLETNEQIADRGTAVRSGPSIRGTLSERYAVIEETLATPKGTLALTRLERDPRRPLVVFCGGSAFRQDVRGAATAEALTAHGDVWLFDYPGYGRSGGRGAPEEFDAVIPAVAARIDQAYADCVPAI